MNVNVTVIESYCSDGKFDGGLSTAGCNPPPEEFLQTTDLETAFRIKSECDRGNIMPFLILSGAVKG